MDKKNDSFIRWQGRSIEELGKAVNLLLGLCIATIGFVISKLIDKDIKFQNCTSKYFMIIGISISLIAVVLLLLLIYNRLFSFKQTTQIARKRELNDRKDIGTLRQEVMQKDKYTWRLFKQSIAAFILSEIFVTIGFIIEITSRK